MNRFLPLVCLVFVLLVSACGNGGSADSGELQATETPRDDVATTTATPRPTHCPPREDLPCDTPAPYSAGPAVGLPPFSVNGAVIPLPPGATSEIAIADPGGANYIYRLVDSFITFLPEGWLVRYEVAVEDVDAFQPTIDALHEAADPVLIGDVVIPVPIGALYQRPIFPEMPEGWIGSPG